MLAAASGGLGAIAGNPFFLMKTRMQVYSTDETMKIGTQRKPERLLKTIIDLAKKEGIKGYFRGLTAFFLRVGSYGAAQLATYDAVKRRLSKDGPIVLQTHPFVLHVTCGVVAAICSVTVIQPFDFVAVRMQNQPIDPITKQGLLYSSPFDCFGKTIRNEGASALFKGYSANVLRFGPYTVLIFVLVERFRDAIKSVVEG